MSQAIVISTNYNGSKRYVTSYFNRFDKTVNVELSPEPEQAKDFGAKTAAEFIARKIFNPFEREYKVEEIEIKPKRTIIQTRTASWLEEKVLK